MTSPIRLLCGLDTCFCCGQGEQVPGTYWRFAKNDDTEVCLCEECHVDYVERTGELITQTIRRSGADPRALIWWGGRQ